jgi:hypothetical protein
MSRLLHALLKADAVRVEADGTLTPTHNRTPKETAAVFHGEQLLLADGEGVKVFNPRRPVVAVETATVEIGAVLGASGACAISQSSVARQSRRCNFSGGVKV